VGLSEGDGQELDEFADGEILKHPRSQNWPFLSHRGWSGHVLSSFLGKWWNVARLTSHWIEWYIFLHLKEVQRTKKSQLESCFSTTCHDVSFWHKCPDRYVRWYVCSTWIYANDILINLYCCR
jgi:hypothetical protein